jgi:3-oxoadipate enol-lactonase
VKNFLYLILIFLFILLHCENIKKDVGFAEINNSRIYYEIAGTGEPIVLIHGWSFDTRCWDDQFEIFNKKYRVLRYDLSGFGHSSLPDSVLPYSHTKDLVSLLEYLNIKKAHVVGHSFGGKVALDFVLNYPEKVISLILADAAMDVPGLKAPKEVISWISDTWKTGKEKGIEEAKKVWMNGPPFIPAMKNPRSASKVIQMIKDYSGWHWIHKDPCNFPKPFHPERLNEIKAPTLILEGELNPKIYHDWADIQKKYIPNSQKEIITNSGHVLNIENPEMFNKLVLEFLSKI